MNLLFKDSLQKIRTVNGLPSVTSVLSILEDPLRIKQWKERVGYEESEAVMTKAKLRGTVIHNHIIDDLVRNFNFIYKPSVLDPVGEMTASIMPFYAGYQTFMQIHRGNFVPFAGEITLLSKALGVSGRPDCLAEFNGKKTIVDWKTSSTAKLDGEILDKYLLQLIAYAFMWNVRFPNDRIEQLMIVPFTKARKSGLGELVLIDNPGEMKYYFAHFEQVLNYFNKIYSNADKSTIIISEEQPSNPIEC